MCVRLIDRIACIILPMLTPDLEVLPPATTHCSLLSFLINFLHSGWMAKFLPGQSEKQEYHHASNRVHFKFSGFHVFSVTKH